MSFFDEKLSRKDFLKKSAVGVAALALLGKETSVAAATAPAGGTTTKATEMTFSDNISPGTFVQPTPPADHRALWVDTGKGGITKYWNGTAWVPTAATWG